MTAIALLQVAAAARAAADKAAADREEWAAWELRLSSYMPSITFGKSTGDPPFPRPSVPKPTDETEDVLRRLADACDALAAADASDPSRQPGGEILISEIDPGRRPGGELLIDGRGVPGRPVVDFQILPREKPKGEGAP